MSKSSTVSPSLREVCPPVPRSLPSSPLPRPSPTPDLPLRSISPLSPLQVEVSFPCPSTSSLHHQHSSPLEGDLPPSFHSLSSLDEVASVRKLSEVMTRSAPHSPEDTERIQRRKSHLDVPDWRGKRDYKEKRKHSSPSTLSYMRSRTRKGSSPLPRRISEEQGTEEEAGRGDSEEREEREMTLSMAEESSSDVSLEVSTDSLRLSPSPPRSIFEEHPPLSKTDSLSPPGFSPPPPPKDTKDSPSDAKETAKEEAKERGRLPYLQVDAVSPRSSSVVSPRRTLDRPRLSVDLHRETLDRRFLLPLIEMPPSSPRSRVQLGEGRGTRRLLSPQNRQLKKEQVGNKRSVPIEIVPLPIRTRTDNSSSEDEEDNKSEASCRVGRHINVTRVKQESIGSLGDELSERPVAFTSDYQDDVSVRGTDEDEETYRARLSSFLTRKRQSEGDNSLFFSSSFVSPVSLNDSCFDLRNMHGGSNSLANSPFAKQSFAFQLGSSTSLPKSTAPDAVSPPTPSVPVSESRKSSNSSSNILDTQLSSSSSSTDREGFDASAITMRKTSVVAPYTRQSAGDVLEVSSSVGRQTGQKDDRVEEGGREESATLPMTRSKSRKDPLCAIPDVLSSSQPSTSRAIVAEEPSPPIRAGKRIGDLRIIEVLRVRVIQVKGLKGSSSKPIFIVAKLDNREIHRSCGYQKNAESIGDEFCREISRFSRLHIVVLEGGKDPSKSARPIGMVSLKRKELTTLSGKELLRPLSVVSSCRDVQGQICLDLKREDDKVTVKVVDYSDLDIKDNTELYVLVSFDANGKDKESKKLKIGSNRVSDETLEMKCSPDSPVHLKMSLWHVVLRGLNTVFHGQVRVDLPAGRSSNQPSKWFYLRSNDGEKRGGSVSDSKDKKDKDSLGEMRLWFSYSSDHVLPLTVYEPLLATINEAVDEGIPFGATLVALIEHIPHTDLGIVARPLVHIFAHSQTIRQLLCKLYEYEIGKCQDMNTLFRSQSLAIKMMNELMKVYGQPYLVSTIKPVVDQIYLERKCCEVDPSRLKPDDSLETNQATLVSYFNLCFNRLVSSSSRCPLPLRHIFADLRKVVQRTTERPEVEMLALSSFLIMRFFAPALLNPKSFGVKRDQPAPDTRVGRTLVLLSKILQRLANCIVSTQPLISKEAWLEPVLSKVITEEKKSAMCAFLDRISLIDRKEDTKEDDVIDESATVLKEGTLVHHPAALSDGKSTLRRIIGGSGKKKRCVILTENEIGWQKNKEDSCLRESISLVDVSTVEKTGKAAFIVKGSKIEMILEAASSEEMNEWVNSIKRQRERAVNKNRSNDTASFHTLDVDIERELETVHTVLVEKADTLAVWKNCLESRVGIPAGAQPLPRIEEGTRERFVATLERVLSVTYTIETAHQEAIKQYKKQMSTDAGSRDNPIGDDHYLLVKSKRSLLNP